MIILNQSNWSLRLQSAAPAPRCCSSANQHSVSTDVIISRNKAHNSTTCCHKSSALVLNSSQPPWHSPHPHPGPSSMEVYGGGEGWAGQRSAAGQRSWGPPGQWLTLVWNSGGCSLSLTWHLARLPAHSRSTLGGQRGGQMRQKKTKTYISSDFHFFDLAHSVFNTERWFWIILKAVFKFF